MDKLPGHTRYIPLVMLGLLAFVLAAAGTQLMPDSPSSGLNPGEDKKVLLNGEEEIRAGESPDAGAAGGVQDNHDKGYDSSISELTGLAEPIPEDPPAGGGPPTPAPEKEEEEPTKAAQAAAPAQEEPPPAGKVKSDRVPAISNHDTNLNPYVQEVIATYSSVLSGRVYIARVLPVHRYRSFR